MICFTILKKTKPEKKNTYNHYKKHKTKEQVVTCLNFPLDSWGKHGKISVEVMNSQIELLFKQHLVISQVSMGILLAWGIINVVVALFLIFRRRSVYFWQMTMFWNFINIGLSFFTLITTTRNLTLAPSFRSVITQLTNTDTLIAANLTLNFSYILVGVLLWQRGQMKVSQRFKGYGVAIFIQGAFLLMFDTVLFITHHKVTQDLISLLSNPAV